MSTFQILAALLVMVFAAYPVISSLVHRWTVAHFTVLNDMKNLGKKRPAGRKLKGTAVVCGGSIAGLLAARVCADHYDEVVVIDPDNDALLPHAHASVPEDVEKAADPNLNKHPRSRVGQYRIIHITQVLNLQALERLFVDFRARLTQMKSPVGPVEKGLYVDGVAQESPAEFYPNGLPDVFTLSRPGYETLLRRLVSNISNVRFVGGTVTGVTPATSGSSKLEAVTYRQGGSTGAVASQDANLVVDCSGVSNAGLTWLKRAGYTLPHKDMYNPHMRYSTTEFNIDPARLAKIIPRGFDLSVCFLTYLANDATKEPRLFGMFQIENDRIQVFTGGWGFKEENRSVAEIQSFLHSLQQSQPVAQWINDVMEYLAEDDVEKTARYEIYTVRPGYNVKFNESAKTLPSNFVAIGDAAMTLPPFFALGMTKAMVDSIVLDSILRKQSTALSSSFGARYFEAHAAKMEPIWRERKYFDYGLDTTEPAKDETRSSGSWRRWYASKLGALEAAGDRDIMFRKFQISQWLAPPTDVLAPKVLAKLAWREVVKAVTVSAA